MVRKTVPEFPAHAAHAISCIWEEAHSMYMHIYSVYFWQVILEGGLFSKKDTNEWVRIIQTLSIELYCILEGLKCSNDIKIIMITDEWWYIYDADNITTAIIGSDDNEEEEEDMHKWVCDNNRNASDNNKENYAHDTVTHDEYNSIDINSDNDNKYSKLIRIPSMTTAKTSAALRILVTNLD